jgi:hypothetical protein
MGRTVFDGLIQKTVARVKTENKLDEHIHLSELFPDSFMKKHTQFSSVEELFESDNFTCGPDEAMSSDEEDLNGHIFITTDFSSWEEMTDAAAREYCAKGRGNV